MKKIVLEIADDVVDAAKVFFSDFSGAISKYTEANLRNLLVREGVLKRRHQGCRKDIKRSPNAL